MGIKQYWSQILAFALGLLLGYILFARNTTDIVTLPPIIGKFEPAVPLSQKPIGEPLVITWNTGIDIIEIETEGEVNTELVDKYKDSLTTLKEQFELYVDAVTYRKFEHTFEDDDLKATIAGITQGYLKEISMPYYEIKEREVEIPSYHRILLGGEIGNNTLLNDFKYKVNAGYQTPKGTMFRVSYSKERELNIIWFGVDFEVLKF